MKAYGEAQSLLQKSASKLREQRQPNELGLVLGTLAHVRYLVGDITQAQRYLGEALQLGLEVNGFMPLYSALPVASLLLARRGDTERALEIYALLSRYPPVANSRWFGDIMGADVDEWAASLTADAAAAARVRCQALDLWQTAEALIIEFGDG